tara:strand:+ start:42 stop:353 length:312 start_codon:yes stop_codon:yes gene_type:complete
MIWKDIETRRKYHRDWTAKDKLNNPEKWQKIRRVKDWKKRGLILHEDETIDMIYERYLSTIQCETCNVVLEGNGANQKCMDHCHITGHFRNILCKACNSKRRD